MCAGISSHPSRKKGTYQQEEAAPYPPVEVGAEVVAIVVVLRVGVGAAAEEGQRLCSLVQPLLMAVAEVVGVQKHRRQPRRTQQTQQETATPPAVRAGGEICHRAC